ncbi:ABC transporter ATP-binding protein [Pleurocapsa sp. CCALA 161]|uniref:ABC transporter ATP-binding protein n=1 Tax=Pleurocapsa sp. CCALA 161 TaxID=2107688 RepID=UPI000D06E26F|nr:ABC transporter ATP-binding protein [Pleurocapsa sp. CCALA 161]
MEIPLKQYSDLLYDYLKPQQGRVIKLAIALLGSIILQILNPQLLGRFIDTAVKGGATKTLITIASVFVGVSILNQGLAILTTYLSETVAWTATNALCIDLAEHCLKLDLSHHKYRTPGEWVERIDGDVVALSRFFSQLVIHVLGNGILLIGILIILFLEDWRAGLSLSLFSGLALLSLLRVQRFAVVPWTRYRQKSAEFFGFIGEQIAGREDIRANGAVGYVMQRFYRTLQSWLPLYHQARFTSTLLWTGSVGLFTIGKAIALALAAYLWQRQAITIGTAYLIFHYTNLLSEPIERIREELEQLQQVEASIYRIRELFNLQSHLQDTGQISLPSAALSVNLENVWFNYDKSLVVSNRRAIDNEKRRTQDQNWTLQDISFNLPAGKTLGLLGHTGSGKTTLARLLLRFYDVDRGTIYLDNTATAQIPLLELRQRVGIVTQDVQLFQASIRDNLTFFDSSINDAEILSTLELLGLIDWLETLSQGLDTRLNSDSSGLSAGQAQLLAFARVFLKNPGLVILDEASSRLDPATEMLIERAIVQLLKDRTAIIIAHRLQTIQKVDQILILERGKILEYGDRITLTQNSSSRFSNLLKLNSNEFCR